jgi:hypothetical protein
LEDSEKFIAKDLEVSKEKQCLALDPNAIPCEAIFSVMHANFATFHRFIGGKPAVHT